VAAGTVELAQVFASVARMVGRQPLMEPEAVDTAAGAADLVPAATAPVEPPSEGRSPVERDALARWRTDDAARVLLLCAAATRDPAALRRDLRDLFASGDSREKMAVLRALALQAVPTAGDTLADAEMVLAAVRSNEPGLVEAALCDNPWAVARLSPLEFRKAVLKGLFLGLDIGRIAGLEARVDAELCASLLDHVAEREAAGRSVPAAVWPLAALHPPPGLAGRLLGCLEHPALAHRLGAAAGLERLVARGDTRLCAFVRDRAAREPDAAVRALLERILRQPAATNL
jgi:hypothetical protein